jgi:hypothetical protein
MLMKRVLILFLALSVLFASVAAAQDDAEEGAIVYSTSFGLGTSFPFNPDEFKDNWNPSFGFGFDVGASRGMLELSVDFDYSFYLADAIDPLDINVLTAFLQLGVKPLETTARPYLFVGAGYFRYWIVDADIYENVLGYGGGAGVEVEIGESRRIFLEGRAVQGRTRVGRVSEDIPGLGLANTEIISVRSGVTFVF